MKRILFVILLAALPAFAQNPTVCNTATVPLCGPGQPSGDVQIKPQAVPASTTVVAAVDAWLKVVTINNPTSGAISFSLCDRQLTPVCVPGAASIPANTSYTLVWPDGRLYWCPSGFTVLASGTGLTFYAGFKL